MNPAHGSTMAPVPVVHRVSSFGVVLVSFSPRFVWPLARSVRSRERQTRKRYDEGCQQNELLHLFVTV